MVSKYLITRHVEGRRILNLAKSLKKKRIAQTYRKAQSYRRRGFCEWKRNNRG